MSRTNTSVVLAERPKGDIVPGKTFHQKQGPAPRAEDLKDGEILVETLYLSLDPAMRGWLDDVRSYVPPVQIGEVMRGSAIARVLASRSPRVAEGGLVTAYTGWREVAIAGPKEFETASDIPLPANGKVTDLQGVLGMTGLTAYFGMTTIGKAKPGETVVVSGAAGATGSVAAQMAKIAGARVVGLAGSDAKCAWLEKELGFDVCLNYKDPDFRKKFKEATPKYIDVYFDNGKFGVSSRLILLVWMSLADGFTRSWWRHPGHGPEQGEQECTVHHVWCYLTIQLKRPKGTTGRSKSIGH